MEKFANADYSMVEGKDNDVVYQIPARCRRRLKLRADWQRRASHRESSSPRIPWLEPPIGHRLISFLKQI